MEQTIWVVIATALITSVCTLVMGYLFYVFRIRPQLEVRMTSLGDAVEDRVRKGVLSAGEELLPKFRDKVTEGFSKALAEWPTSEMTRMARTGANLVEEGLNTLLGKKRD